MSDTIERSTFDAQQIEHVLKGATIAVALCYAAGLLTVNFYLYSLGVMDFSLLRPRFVLSGFLALLPVVWMLVAIVFSLPEPNAPSAQHTSRSAPHGFRYDQFWYLMAFWFAVWMFATTRVLGEGFLSSVANWFKLSFLAALQATVLLLAWSVPRKVTHQAALRLFGSFLVLVFNVWYLTSFADDFYDVFPQQVGGGRPIVGRFIFTEDGADGVQHLGLDVSSERPLSPPLAILWEGDGEYVVRVLDSDETRVLRVDKDMVSIVIVGEDVSANTVSPQEAVPGASPPATPATMEP